MYEPNVWRWSVARIFGAATYPPDLCHFAADRTVRSGIENWENSEEMSSDGRKVRRQLKLRKSGPSLTTFSNRIGDSKRSLARLASFFSASVMSRNLSLPSAMLIRTMAMNRLSKQNQLPPVTPHTLNDALLTLTGRNAIRYLLYSYSYSLTLHAATAFASHMHKSLLLALETLTKSCTKWTQHRQTATPSAIMVSYNSRRL